MDQTDALQAMPDDWTRALVIVAHPDDIEYGAAAAVATWTTAGRDIRYVLATRGEAGIDGMEPEVAGPVREQEQIRSAAVVGVSVVEFLGHRDGHLEEGLALRRDLAAAIRRHRPELVVTLNHHETWTTGVWNTADHRALARSVLDATADAGNRWIFPDLDTAGLAPWNGVRWVAVAGSPQPTHATDVTGSTDRAVASLSEHRQYLEKISPTPVEEQARDLVDRATAPSERFGGRRAVSFELFSR